MVADLREMQENQGFSEIWIDKLRFVEIIITGNARYGKKKRDPDRIMIRVPLCMSTPKRDETGESTKRRYLPPKATNGILRSQNKYLIGIPEFFCHFSFLKSKFLIQGPWCDPSIIIFAKC